MEEVEWSSRYSDYAMVWKAGRDKRFSHLQNASPGCLAIWRYMQWVPADLLLGEKQQEPASDHLAPSGA